AGRGEFPPGRAAGGGIWNRAASGPNRNLPRAGGGAAEGLGGPRRAGQGSTRPGRPAVAAGPRADRRRSGQCQEFSLGRKRRFGGTNHPNSAEQRSRCLMGMLRLAALSPALFAGEEGEGGHGNPREMLWRVVNFAILAGGLGYFVKKKAGPMFAARSRAIATEIAEARALVEQSEARARSIEERFAGLGREIEGLRSGAKAEVAAEQARLEREAERAVGKISAPAEHEIVAGTVATRLGM